MRVFIKAEVPKEWWMHGLDNRYRLFSVHDSENELIGGVGYENDTRKETYYKDALIICFNYHFNKKYGKRKYETLKTGDKFGKYVKKEDIDKAIQEKGSYEYNADITEINWGKREAKPKSVVHASVMPMTKVDAIKHVMQDNGGTSDWQSIYENTVKYYPSIKNSTEWQAGIRGVLYREIKNNRNFRKTSKGTFELIDYDKFKQVNRTPIFFANVTWMKRYDGLEGSFERPGAAHVRQYNDAGEKNNFKETDGKYYGFVQCNKNSQINIDTIANRYNCEIVNKNGDRCIENAIVVFFSTPKEGTAKIVGFYKNATIFENYLVNSNGDWYFFVCNSEDGVLIPADSRTFQIPKVENGVTYYGQDQRWYADKDEHLPLIKRVLDYIENYNGLEIDTDSEKEDDIISKALRDSDIEIEFDISNIKGDLPINDYREHKYSVSRTSGTSKESVQKIYNGRKAEKYFIDYLIKNSFKKDEDFLDVANNKNYGYDIQFFDAIGLEIKNIRSGSFYLSDNEIGYLESGNTHLVLIDINNGIWLLKNNSVWLKRIICDIKSVREYCKGSFPSIDLTDIRININDAAKTEICDISKFDYDKILSAIMSTD